MWAASRLLYKSVIIRSGQAVNGYLELPRAPTDEPRDGAGTAGVNVIRKGGLKRALNPTLILRVLDIHDNNLKSMVVGLLGIMVAR